MVSVPSVDQNALPAFAMMGTLLRAAAIVDSALPDFVQGFHLEPVLLLRRHGLILLAKHFFVIVDLYLFFVFHLHPFPHR